MAVRSLLARLVGLGLLAVSVPLWYGLFFIGLSLVLSLPEGAFGEPVVFALYALFVFGLPVLLTFGLSWAGVYLVLGPEGRQWVLRRRAKRSATQEAR